MSGIYTLILDSVRGGKVPGPELNIPYRAITGVDHDTRSMFAYCPFRGPDALRWNFLAMDVYATGKRAIVEWLARQTVDCAALEDTPLRGRSLESTLRLTSTYYTTQFYGGNPTLDDLTWFLVTVNYGSASVQHRQMAFSNLAMHGRLPAVEMGWRFFITGEDPISPFAEDPINGPASFLHAFVATPYVAIEDPGVMEFLQTLFPGRAFMLYERPKAKAPIRRKAGASTSDAGQKRKRSAHVSTVVGGEENVQPAPEKKEKVG